MPDAATELSPVTLRSATPGRIRLNVRELVDQTARCSQVCEAMAEIEGVRSVKVNSLTGSVLLLHAPDLSPALLGAQVKTVVERLRAQRLGPVVQAEAGGARTNAPALPRGVPENGQNLAGVLAAHRRPALRSFLFTLVDRLFEASPPALISLAVDAVTRKEQSTLSRASVRGVPGQLRLLVAAGLAVWTADSTVGYLRAVAGGELGSVVRQDLRDELYRHFQTLDLAQIEGEPPTYWNSIFNEDTETVAEYFQDGIDPLVSILANSLIVLWQMFRTSFSLAMLQVAMVPGLYLISQRLLPPMQSRRKLASKAEGRLEANLQANVQGISTIASFAREPDEARRIAALGAVAGQMERSSLRLSSLYVPALQMVVGLGFLGTLGFGGLLVGRGRIVSGQLSMMGYSSLRLLQALGYVGVSVDNLQKARMAMSRIDAFRARVPQVQSGRRALPARSVRGHIELRNVSFSYLNEAPLFRDLNLAFPAGASIGIVGQSGAGKTTLLKLLQRYYDVLGGEVLLDGQPVRSLRLDDLRRSIAYVPQQPFIFPGTIRENIAYGRPEASDAEVQRAATVAAASEFIEQLPNGYETLVRGSGTGGAGQALSGGQAQRLAIARAALANAPVLLFDEATSAVDNETEAALQRSLHDFSAGRTTIIVAHRLSMVRRADHILVMEQGAVREQGTHDELLARDGIYAGFWRVQTGEPPAVAKAAAKSARPRRPAVLAAAVDKAPRARVPEKSAAPAAKKKSAARKKGATRRQDNT